MKTYKIYPSLGCARVGNGPAKKEHVIFTPEVPWENQDKVSLDYLMPDGAIKKQAQRFRIYECDANGVPTKQIEIGKDGVQKVKWHADVANKKAFWYDFNNALDLSVLKSNGNISPEVAKNRLAPSQTAKLRNPNVLGEMREQLVIAPGKKTVSKESTTADLSSSFPSPQKTKYKGLVMNLIQHLAIEPDQVKLGSLEYDDDGTLIFYPGDGISEALKASSLNDDFADNSNWHDDICDGKISATVTVKVDGLDVDIELNAAENSAWIATAPPDYAPQIEPLSTMYDMVNGASYSTADVDAIEDTTFSEIFPIIQRLYRMQWVNQGDFLEYSLKAELEKIDFQLLMDNNQDKGSEAYKTRKQIFDKFRNPNFKEEENRIIPSNDQTSLLVPNKGPVPQMPYYPNDGVDYPGSPMQWFAIPPVMFKRFKLWSEGLFSADAEVQKLKNVEEVSQYYYTQGFAKANNPALLSSRAVVDTLYGGGFHPGVELTWPLRHDEIYAENKYSGAVNDKINLGGVREFRINAADEGSESDHFYNNFGHLISSEFVTDSLQPESNSDWLWEITPGDLTKWMGIPWQSDAASCQAVYTQEDFPIPVWWPANLPVHVVSKDSYESFKNDESSADLRRNLFAYRQEWLHTADLGFVGYHAEGGYTNGLIQMVYKWKNMGMVTGREVANPVPGIPPVVYVALNGKNTEVPSKGQQKEEKLELAEQD